MKFPNDFIWGAASASYQIEGAAFQDGKGPSIWDMFCRRPGAIKGGDSGDVSCDHYNRLDEDIALMREIGLKAYRFSVSWPRILPGGRGNVNEKGLDFYDRLTDKLLKNGIEPYVTLFHWDYPYELHERGGWLNPESPEWFADYSRTVVERLSDRVANWFTVNEPMTFVNMGYEYGMHAPGLKLGTCDRLAVAHNLLLAHGKSVQVIRECSKQLANIGFAMGTTVKFPSTRSTEDINAAREGMFSMTGPDIWANSWWLDPVFFGHYPEDGVKVYEEYMPEIGCWDMKTISKPVDFLGLNIYNGTEVKKGPDGPDTVVEMKCGAPKTLNGWTVTPEAIYWGPRYVYERYKTPLIIAENGMAGMDWVSLDGRVHDAQRVDFMTRYLCRLHEAINDGIDVRGYFHWSVMDNFEWAEGYDDRFGLIYVDYGTRQRVIKDSGLWYGRVIGSNGRCLERRGLHD